MDIVVWVLLAIVVLAAVAAFMVPKTVHYKEVMTVISPVAQVYDNIRFQEDLMRWSAWPSTTKSTCEAAGQDGAIGAQTVFFSKGKRFGHQEVIALEENRLVTFRLFGAGPPQKPTLTFHLDPIGPNETKVTLDFHNDIPRPFNIVLRLFGIVRWTREMHRKDLDGLKRFSEPPHVTYVGAPAPTRVRPAAA